jgi:hypothetical protein
MERLSIKCLGKEAIRAVFSSEMKKKMNNYQTTRRLVFFLFIYQNNVVLGFRVLI